jgi:hypothetical protein
LAQEQGWSVLLPLLTFTGLGRPTTLTRRFFICKVQMLVSENNIKKKICFPLLLLGLNVQALQKPQDF